MAASESVTASALGYIQTMAKEPLFLVMIFPILFTVYVVVNEVLRYKARIPSFSGPVGYPVFGNLPQTQGDAAEKYRSWAKKYGPVYQVQLGNMPVLVVNSAEKSKEIFLTNSRSSNSRPLMYTFHTLVSSTQGFTIGSSPMDESLKRRRKAAASALNKPAVQTYVPHIDLETKEFINDAFKRGQAGQIAIDPMPIVKRLSLNLSLTLNWGTRIENVDDPMFKEIIEVEENVSLARSVTTNMQDYVPLLRLNPFNKDSRLARDTRRRRDVYLRKLNKELEERIANKTYKPCIQANILLDPEAKLNAAELMSISVTMINAGLDTVVSTLYWGLAMLASRPDVQEKAYAAIRERHSDDEVLCDPVEDQKCEYVVALVKEMLRYFTPLRLSLPRTTSTDMVYEGKKIPKGTLLFHNTWACNMDPKLYNNPHEFRPERFIENPTLRMFSYGEGARMCAGNLLGNRELYVMFMRVISSYTIHKATDVDVNPLTGVHDPAALGTTPHPYKVIFKPRNEKILAAALANHVPVAV
jgi:3-hydroxyphenylacetate 6-hydroxylase